MAIDESKIEEFMGKVVTELGACEGVALHRIGDQLGIWKAMAGAGALTPAQVAERASCDERYVREWLAAETAAEYIEYDEATGTFTLNDLVAAAMADEDSPMFLGGAWQLACSVFTDLPKVTAAFKTGGGVGWGEHSHDLFEGVERFFRPGYNTNLVAEWLPALDGVVEKLEAGAKVADVGCGHGASTIILAQAYPNSTFVGYDTHDASIVHARKAAAEAGVADRVTFEVAPAQSYPGTGYDLVCFFDCLHDMGDPDGAAKHVRSTLADDGTWLLVEPYANGSLTENMNPVGRVYYASSTLICLPASLADEGRRGLGNQVPDDTWAEVTQAVGFSRFRRATETAFNRVFEVRP
ncbi:MAG TPA: class I SAM-dependent methyltransferase [Acidimicrobiales bacterium]|nr:class I SAM-dependent methyltransferase [Acidimicrobiales bacterium]